MGLTDGKYLREGAGGIDSKQVLESSRERAGWQANLLVQPSVAAHSVSSQLLLILDTPESLHILHQL